MKTDLSLVTKGQMKRLVNESHFFSLMSVKSIKACDFEHKNEICKCVSNYEVFQNSPKLQHEDFLRVSIREPINKIRDVVDSFLVASIY